MILLPDKSKRSLDDFPFFKPLEHKQTLHIACPYLATVKDLKTRISGLTRIPLPKIRLVFEGEVLQDDAVLPLQAFNTQVSAKNVVDDVFRCRLYLSIDASAGDGELPDVSDISQDSSDSSGRGSEEPSEPASEPPPTAPVAQLVEPLVDEDEVDRLLKQQREQEFDLRKDLAKISCERYYDILAAEGYADEGAFAQLTDEELRPLFVPQLARARIGALADTLRRRLELLHREQDTLKMQVERFMVETADTVTAQSMEIDGVDILYAKKSDIAEAWREKGRRDGRAVLEEAERRRAEERRLHLRLHGPPPREHSDAMQRRIAFARIRCAKDDLGVSLWAAPRPRTFCCAKHCKDSAALQSEAVQARRRSAYALIHAFLRRHDYYCNGFVSREVLLAASAYVLGRVGLTMDEEELQRVLRGSEMSRDEQTTSQHWSTTERWAGEGRYGAVLGLPVLMYSMVKYEQEMLDAIAILDRKRLVGY